MTWDKNHYIFKCSDGEHDSFWKTVTESEQWKLWQREQSRRFKLLTEDKLSESLGVYDMPEVEECGWISQDHFQQFIRFTIDSLTVKVCARRVVTRKMWATAMLDIQEYVREKAARDIGLQLLNDALLDVHTEKNEADGEITLTLSVKCIKATK